ncbi:hypothetical protein H5410_005177 [Solanum commersonii]|uniref:Uncharacterized protein n=1 Tax=Solanum commersonii TaxID=4109 RepID=A0A9J6A7D8_SOLCO|nr:hypothetical protein H5410_005177 [Solanum commersonii]
MRGGVGGESEKSCYAPRVKIFAANIPRKRKSYCFICQCTRSRNNSNTSWFVNVSRHNSNFALSWFDNTWAIWTNQPSSRLLLKSSFYANL